MLHNLELRSYFFPLGAPVVALSLVAGIAHLTERAIGPTPAIVAEPMGAFLPAEAPRLQLIPEGIAKPPVIADPASAAEPPTIADPASAAEPPTIAQPPTVADPASAAAPPTIAQPPTVADPASAAAPSIVVAAATPPDAPATSDALLPDPRAVQMGLPIPKPKLATKTRERGSKPMGRSQVALTPRSALLDGLKHKVDRLGDEVNRLWHKVPATRPQVRPYSTERKVSSVAAPVASEASSPKPRAAEKVLSIPKPKLASKTRPRILQPTGRLQATPTPRPAPVARIPQT